MMQRSERLDPVPQNWPRVLATAAAPAQAVARWSYIAVACAVLVLLGARGIESEATVSLQGDMPRYLMNGVFVHDFVRDHPFDRPLEYTYLYYARYPALSLGHHPALLAAVTAPFFGVFGVSVWTGRLVILLFATLAVAAWFSIMRRFYGDAIAFVAALLLATTPFLVEHVRVVLSEIPALALMLVTVAMFLRFADTLQWRDALGFAFCAGLSVYAKHHTLFIVPILLLYLALRRGPSVLFRRETIAAGILLVAILAPLIPITLEFSRANVAWIRSGGQARMEATNLLFYANALWTRLLSPAVIVMAAAAALVGAWKRDARIGFLVLWIVGFYAELAWTGARSQRYAIYLIPPFLGLIAAGLSYANGRVARAVVVTALGVVIAVQGWIANAAVPTYADGYEAAARYVSGRPHGQTVLYSAQIDSGYFVFFMRKHGESSHRVVLRADKLLATSSIGRIIAEQIHSRDELYAILRDLGVGYVVLEDLPYKSPALELLRTEVRGSEFAERKRIPLRTNRDELSGVDLVVYEYVNHQPARPDTPLRLRVPLMGRTVEATIGELSGQTQPRAAR